MWAAFVRFVSEVCAVPPQPAPPAGSSGTVQVIRAAPGWYRYRLLLFALRQLPVIVSLGIGIAVAEIVVHEALAEAGAEDLYVWVRAIELGSAGLWLLGLATGYAIQRLDYEMRWYTITDRSLRIREGVIFVKELTLTFANVQNVTVNQGPLQRAFGVADVRVQTAGGGAPQPGQGEPLHMGVLRGIADAEALRELVLRRVRSYDDAGLGDPDDRTADRDAPVASACAAVVAEARALADTAERVASLRAPAPR